MIISFPLLPVSFSFSPPRIFSHGLRRLVELIDAAEEAAENARGFPRYSEARFRVFDCGEWCTKTRPSNPGGSGTRDTNFSGRRVAFATRAFKLRSVKNIWVLAALWLGGKKERSLRCGSTHTVEPPVGMTNNCAPHQHQHQHQPTPDGGLYLQQRRAGRGRRLTWAHPAPSSEHRNTKRPNADAEGQLEERRQECRCHWTASNRLGIVDARRARFALGGLLSYPSRSGWLTLLHLCHEFLGRPEIG